MFDYFFFKKKVSGLSPWMLGTALNGEGDVVFHTSSSKVQIHNFKAKTLINNNNNIYIYKENKDKSKKLQEKGRELY